MKKLFLFITAACLAQYAATAQTGNTGKVQEDVTASQKGLKQRVRGRVTDAESKQPLPGVIVVLASNNQVNALTDIDGYFLMEGVPIGRQSFQFIMAGFDQYTVSEAMVISGKDLELNVAMNESLHQLDEVTIKANIEKEKPLNEFATVSARSFSVEETRRYAASFADPARMVMNFPGVSNGGDMDNSIVVRGNSPKSVLWRLEGIEIPNPNHFTALGASGGAVSMLNANTLGSSDFYTGAFAPEIGNALSAAFDLNLRDGNTERREHTVQIGTLGLELATEGPFQKGKKASYLFNYRYSTLALLGRFLDLGGAIPAYQDASFKINLPTEKAGTFSIFGLGGYNKVAQEPKADSSKWDDDNPNIKFDNESMMGVAGVSHQYFLNKDAYIKTIVSASLDKSTQNADTLNPAKDYIKVPVEQTSASNTAFRLSVMFNQKLSARNTFRAGIIAQQLAYNMDYRFYHESENQWKTLIDGNGSTQFYQAYLQLKSRLTDKLTFIGGVHSSYLAINRKYSLEPRAALSYQASDRNKFTLAAGLHSKPEHLSTYMFENTPEGQPVTYPNKNLDLQRAFHGVAGYETVLPWKLRLKIETYYQHLYSIPVEKDTVSGFSIINARDVYSLLSVNNPLVSEGTGDNYGVDISFERPFMNSYYVIATGSVFKSTYTNYKGDTYNTTYNRGYQANVIGGKEFKLNASGQKLLGINGKVLYSGGMRESKIDIAKSIANGKTELVPGQYYTQKAPEYFRADASVYYKFNLKKSTHSINLEVQNVTNRQNYYYSYFDVDAGTTKRVNQLGIFPNISYRIDFH